MPSQLSADGELRPAEAARYGGADWSFRAAEDLIRSALERVDDVAEHRIEHTGRHSAQDRAAEFVIHCERDVSPLLAVGIELPDDAQMAKRAVDRVHPYLTCRPIGDGPVGVTHLQRR